MAFEEAARADLPAHAAADRPHWQPNHGVCLHSFSAGASATPFQLLTAKQLSELRPRTTKQLVQLSCSSKIAGDVPTVQDS